jgi:predicted aspartyl protease
MSTFNVTLEVGDPKGEAFESVEALVDTDSTFTVLPVSLLRRLGVTPHRRTRFEMADGSQTDWDVGQTVVRLKETTQTTVVVFGSDNTEPTLGAVTLEEFLLGVDPVRQELVPATGLLMRGRRFGTLR